MAPTEDVTELPIRSKAPQVKLVKGTRDWFGDDMIIRENLLSEITNIFKAHAGKALSTPHFELREILAGKYGEDSKLIYDLADQGGELAALRYDLTVPLARFVALNAIQQMRRYHIGSVFRRDNPAIARGRLREFTQCDFDIVGVYDPMIPDSEIVRIIFEVFRALNLGVVVKLNHRKILDGIFTVAGVPPEKIRTISSAVDKLDKAPWAEVKREMVDEKGLPEDVADKIGAYVQKSGNITEMLDALNADTELTSNEDIKAGLKDLGLLADYTKAMNCADQISFDLSLARGLDYYTGLIYEVVFKPGPEFDPPKGGKRNKAAEEARLVGSIAAGGRYDNLVGMYGKTQIPCCGISFGVDRIFTILKARRELSAEPVRLNDIDVFVMAFGGKDFNGLLLERMSIISQLWDAGIKAEFSAKVKPKLPQQFKAAGDIPLAVILGEDELAQNKVRVKALGLPDDHPEKEGALVDKSDLVTEIRKRLVKS